MKQNILCHGGNGIYPVCGSLSCIRNGGNADFNVYQKEKAEWRKGYKESGRGTRGGKAISCGRVCLHFTVSTGRPDIPARFFLCRNSGFCGGLPVSGERILCHVI